MYGIVQGLTEFLPISSSAHLFLISDFLGWRDAGAGFTAVIQLGTILAVLIYFRKDVSKTWTALLQSLSKKEKERPEGANLAYAIIFGSIPIAVLGVLLEKRIDRDFRSAVLVAITLIVLGIALFVAEKLGKQSKSVEEIKPKDGIITGLWQCLALIPGSSRSGSTITGMLALGYKREAAARFSFLLSIPVILLSGLYKLYKEKDTLMAGGAVPTIVATVVSFVVGYMAIAFLMSYLQKKSTAIFVVYRIALGIIILALVATGKMSNQPQASAGVKSHEFLQTKHKV